MHRLTHPSRQHSLVDVPSAKIIPTIEPSAQRLLSLARARVFERMKRAVDFPLLVICAPTGYGKSTVVREFLAAQNRPNRALHLTSGHGDLLAFMRAFANALDETVPALLAAFMGVYERMHGFEDAAKEIASWAASHLELVDLTLMIDGLENITDERLFRLLGELIDQTSNSRVRWILVAEAVDRFPIARWLANDRMDLPLDDIDLELTYDDLVAAVERSGASIGESTLRAVCRAAANQPAAIALALSDPCALSAIAADPFELRSYSYFAERAFAARTQSERRFLRETCLYKHFDRALLATAGWLNIEPMLDRLREAGAILFSDGEGGYRYHELFRAFVEEKLRAGPERRYTRIRAASALVCRQVGRWSDALAFYTGLQAALPLAELLSERGFELLDRGEADLVLRGLGALSDEEFAAFPVALAVRASLESLHGSFDLAEAWFRHAIKSVGDSSQRGQIVFRFATDLVRQDRRDAIDVLRPIVAEGGHSLDLSVSLAGLLATAYATHQENAQAALTIEQALRDLGAVEDAAVRAKVYFQAGYVAFFARDPVRSKWYAHQALETALASHLYDIAARALSILYNVAMDYDDDVRGARLYLDHLAACSIKAGSRHLLTYATLAQFEIEVFRGNLAESARLDEALKLLEVDYSVFASETLLPAQALRATWSGDFHRAYLLIAATAEKQITPMRQSQRYAEIALYAAAAGLRAEAGAAASRAVAIAAKADAGDTSVAFTKSYVALALNLLGRHRRAARIVAGLRGSPALTPRLAQLLEAIRTINDRWARGRYSADLRDTLERLERCDFGGIVRLIEALPLPQTFRGQFKQLTAAEREALIHLSAGLNAAQIGALSDQTAEAVDALILSLCRKLGCTSQRHAVALAKSADGSRLIAMNVH